MDENVGIGVEGVVDESEGPLEALGNPSFHVIVEIEVQLTERRAQGDFCFREQLTFLCADGEDVGYLEVRENVWVENAVEVAQIEFTGTLEDETDRFFVLEWCRDLQVKCICR